MVKDHSDSERGNQLPPHGLLFLINSKGSFICRHHPSDRIAHTTAFVTPVVEHWLEREIACCRGSRWQETAQHVKQFYVGTRMSKFSPEKQFEHGIYPLPHVRI